MRQEIIIGAHYDDDANAMIVFGNIRNGQSFIMVNPPLHLKRLRAVIMIKINSNRAQELADDNVRILHNGDFGPCRLVHINSYTVDVATQ